MKTRIAFSTRIIGILMLSGCVACFVLLGAMAILPHQSKLPVPKTLVINKGDRLSLISAKLKQQDLIWSQRFFKWYSIVMGKTANYKHGEYLIEREVSVTDLVKILEEGRTVLVPVTFPEGLRMTEIFSILQDKGYENKGEYSALSNSPEFIKALGYQIEANTLEGFLFPDTYKFAKSSVESTILATMVKTFFQKIPKNYEQLAAKVNLTFYEAVILASIIEKETSVGSERPLISSVFHNRLQKKMRLQTDPSVIYGIENFDGNLTRKLLKTNSPYNTYIRFGLPPTPIANPSLDSLIAAVQPNKTEYIYFVAKGDGTHVFTSNYDDHKNAVIKYQQRRNSRYRSF